jgi:hypothetical protein
MIEHGSVPPRLVTDSNLESDFKIRFVTLYALFTVQQKRSRVYICFFFLRRILNVSLARLECLVKFLPLVLDKLLLLLVKPPVLNNFQFKNIGQAVFETLANVVQLINMVSVN